MSYLMIFLKEILTVGSESLAILLLQNFQVNWSNETVEFQFL